MKTIGERLTEWVDKFWSYQSSKHESKKDLVIVMLLLITFEKSMEMPNPVEIDEILESSLAYRIIDSRSAFVGLKITRAAKYFLTMLVESPGEAVMYIYALRHNQLGDVSDDGKTTPEINMEYIKNLFRDGYPSKEELMLAWEEQKMEDGSNLLDHVNPSVDFGDLKILEPKCQDTAQVNTSSGN